MNDNNNLFSAGDLLHMPQGTVLYHKIKRHFFGSGTANAIPIKVVEKPTIALVMEKDINDFYLVSIKDQEYLIKGYDVSLVNEELERAY